MIGLKVNGGWLELAQNVTFSDKRTSPIFYGKNFNIISGGYSLPITIDASPLNRKLLKFPEFLNNRFGRNEYECEFYWDGNLINIGILNWKEVSQETYKIQFFSSAGALAQLKEKTFFDYDWGEEIEIDSSQIPSYTDFQIFAFMWDKYIDTPFGYYYLTLAHRAKEALRLVFNQEGFNFDDDFFNDDFFSRLLFWKPWQMVKTADFTSPFMVNLKNAAPKQFVADTLRGLANMFCLAIDIDSSRKKVVFKTHNDLLNNPLPSIDMTDRVISKITKSKIRGSEKSLIKELKYELFDKEADNNEDGKKIADFNILDAVVDLSDLPTTAQEGDAIFIYDKGYYLLWDSENEAWDLENDFQTLHGFKIADSGTEIKSTLCPAYMVDFQNSGLLPSTNVQPHYYYNAEDTSLSSANGFVMLARGSFSATYNNYNEQGNIEADKNLMWHGPHGLYEKFWKKWLTYLNEAYECEVEMQLTDADLFNWNPLQPIRIFDEHSGGYHYFYWVERKIVLNNNGIQAASQKLIQVIF